jgi:hypothetical protein
MPEGAPKPNNPQIKIEEIREKRVALYESFSAKEFKEFQNKLVKYIKDIRLKYPNFDNYVLYHILIGSTVPDDITLIEDDFPWDDSVENFLKNYS